MWFDVFLTILPAIILFLYGIEHFSKEILKISGENFRKIIQKLTKTPARGLVSGAFVTSIIQSSAATTIITLSLVNSGILSFSQSLGVIFGANIGTAFTAQLIAFKLTFFAPFLIVGGFLISIMGGKYKFIGKPLFYFGLVFFSLNLISDSIIFLKDVPDFLIFFNYLSNFFIAILLGIIITNIFQSSAVTTGLAVIFTLNGIITFEQALPFILGSNIGTTALSLFISRGMDLYAKRTAMAHFLFNVIGIILLLPFLSEFTAIINYIGGEPANMVANAHLLFNLSAGLFFLIFIKQFKFIIEYFVRGDDKEVLLGTKYLNDKLPENNDEAFDLIEKELKYNLEVANEIFNESFNAIKTKRDLTYKIEKLETLTDIIDEKITDSLLEMSRRNLTSNEVEKLIKYARMSNSIEQIGDLGKQLNITYSMYNKKGIYFHQEGLIDFETNYIILVKNFFIISNNFPLSNENNEEFVSNYNTLFKNINSHYNSHIKRMVSKRTLLGSYFVESMSILENLNDKLLELNRLMN